MHGTRTVTITVLAGLAIIVAASTCPLAQTGPTASLPQYPLASTALLVVDPYNDFLSEGGKAWPATKATATTQGLIEHMQQALGAARNRGLKVFIVPHRRYQPGDWEGARFLPYRQTLQGIQKSQLFARGSGVVNSGPSFSRSRAMSSRASIGYRAALPTPTSTCS